MRSILIASTLIAAVTPSTTVAAGKTFEPTLVGFVIPNGANIYVANTIAQAGAACIEGSAF